MELYLKCPYDMFIHGVGNEVMQRIAAPMSGGVVSSAILSLVIIPILYEIYMKWEMTKDEKADI